MISRKNQSFCAYQICLHHKKKLKHVWMLFFYLHKKSMFGWKPAAKKNSRHNPVWKKQIKNISSFNAATAVLRWNIESSTYAFMYTWNKKSFQYYFLFRILSHMNLYFFLLFFSLTCTLLYLADNSMILFRQFPFLSYSREHTK